MGCHFFLAHGCLLPLILFGSKLWPPFSSICYDMSPKLPRSHLRCPPMPWNWDVLPSTTPCLHQMGPGPQVVFGDSNSSSVEGPLESLPRLTSWIKAQMPLRCHWPQVLWLWGQIWSDEANSADGESVTKAAAQLDPCCPGSIEWLPGHWPKNWSFARATRQPMLGPLLQEAQVLRGDSNSLGHFQGCEGKISHFVEASIGAIGASWWSFT